MGIAVHYKDEYTLSLSEDSSPVLISNRVFKYWTYTGVLIDYVMDMTYTDGSVKHGKDAYLVVVRSTDNQDAACFLTGSKTRAETLRDLLEIAERRLKDDQCESPASKCIDYYVRFQDGEEVLVERNKWDKLENCFDRAEVVAVKMHPSQKRKDERMSTSRSFRGLRLVLEESTKKFNIYYQERPLFKKSFNVIMTAASDPYVFAEVYESFQKGQPTMFDESKSLVFCYPDTQPNLGPLVVCSIFRPEKVFSPRKNYSTLDLSESLNAGVDVSAKDKFRTSLGKSTEL